MKNSKMFSPGTLVLIDGKVKAKVNAYFPEGSMSYLFPHYKVDFINGDKNVAVSVDRVVVRKLKNL